MDLGDNNKVWEIKALKRKPEEDKAHKILDKIAKQVQPLMKKHKWRVKLLTEFCPTNPALLGVNVGHGIQVKLRLRKHNRDLDFIPYNQVLDTMLHELCHNVHSPHNAAFYKLWDDLRKECEELMSKGVTGTGEGFDCPGRRLGGFSRQPPLSSLRQTAMNAAEKRARMGSLLPSGPRRVGGDSNIMGALSPMQAAAMAAERRMQDELWCGSQASEVSLEGESSSDMSQERPPTGCLAESSKRSSNLETSASDKIHSKKSRIADTVVATNISSNVGLKFCRTKNIMQPSTSGPILDHKVTDYTEEKSFWECGICTLFNPPLAPICEACSNLKPKDVEAKFKFWSCKFCTLENNIKLDKCSACGQWRYSYGEPVSSRLNIGT
ncbi:Dna-dependent metalloprotease wss1-like [Thalictrum thalictroides]|uniref:Dna-dependent metalloprotease wss1-like n=1 Tax=Thalictrum thalictroides TaxID=46969 RepID=A0A7J6X9F5_THATH|nr:Dna-dependent metalloprotease wss1-like [Thalictrum thalictroides]